MAEEGAMAAAGLAALGTAALEWRRGRARNAEEENARTIEEAWADAQAATAKADALQAELDRHEQQEASRAAAQSRAQAAARAWVESEQEAEEAEEGERRRELEAAFERGVRAGADQAQGVTQEQHDAALRSMRETAMAQLAEAEESHLSALDAAAEDRHAAIEALQQQCDEALAEANTARAQAVAERERAAARHAAETTEWEQTRASWLAEKSSLVAQVEQAESARDEAVSERVAVRAQPSHRLGLVVRAERLTAPRCVAAADRRPRRGARAASIGVRSAA